MGRLKEVREKAGVAKPRRDRTVVRATMDDLRKIEFETVSNSRRIAAVREEKRENKFIAMTKLLPVTQLCCKRWGMMCTKLHGLPLIKGQDRVKLAGYAKRYSAGRGDFLRYMDWCLDHWRMVVEAKLGWMRDKPLIPSIPIFVRWSQHFEHLWLHKEESEALAQMTERDQIIARAIARGASYDAAEREADERMGLTYQRQAVEEERKQLVRERQRLEASVDRVDRIGKVESVRGRAAHLIKSKRTSGAAEFGGWRDDE